MGSRQEQCTDRSKFEWLKVFNQTENHIGVLVVRAQDVTAPEEFVETRATYDEAGHLRFVSRSANRRDATRSESLVYFSESGERIWEVSRSGPRSASFDETPFAMPRIALAIDARDPKIIFDQSRSRCAE